ncbi:MAG: hypothetical protein JWM05_1633 [Acidimicrobiales bacterium]|nr:hypothetical protein [Acidimicrobiales bacterium]
MTALLDTTTGARQARVLTPAPRADWQRCYEADDTAVVTQSPRWTDAMVATGRWTDASRHYRFPDGRELVLPLVRRRGLTGAAPQHSMPDAWGYGGLVGSAVDDTAVAAVVDDLRAARTAWVRIRPNPLHADAWRDGAAVAGGTLQLPKRAHALRLDADPDEIFRSRFTSAARRAVRSAEKSGLTVEVDRTGRLAPVFHALLGRSVERWAGSQHEPLALARWRAERRDPLEKFQAWAQALDGDCHILVARRQGLPIAAMIVLQGHNAHMTRSAMDLELVGRDRPNELLMWHAIRAASAAGCGWFHLGESGDSATLSRYKEKYGAVGMDYAEHRIEHLPATRVDTALRSSVKRLIGFNDR